MNLLVDRVPSPVGTILLVSSGAGLCAVHFGEFDERVTPWLRRRFGDFHPVDSPDPHGSAACMRAYLAGHLQALDDLPLDTGGTEFQRRVWTELRRIPAGATATYGGLAARLGVPGAARAVGLANGTNPVAIVVPCHRVIGSSGKLTGYGGGLPRKQWLLEHEGVSLPCPGSLFPAY